MSQFFDEALEESNLTHAALRVRHVILGFVVIVTLFAMAYVFLEIDRELERSSSVNSDNVTWTLSQVEVDTLKLQRAVIIAADNPADPDALDDLRLAFDIFYSRFNILARSDQIAGLGSNLLMLMPGQHQIDRIRRPAQKAEATRHPQFHKRRTRRGSNPVGIDLQGALVGGERAFGHLSPPTPRAAPAPRQDRPRTAPPVALAPPRPA